MTKFILAHERISDIILMNIDLLPVINQLGLGTEMWEKTLDEACISLGKDIRFVINILNTYAIPDFFPEPDDIDLKLLIDFLVKTHKEHKDVFIPKLTGLIDKMKTLMPGEKLPYIIDQYLNRYISELLKHIEFEENEIFPMVNRTPAAITKNARDNFAKLYKQHIKVENEISDLKTVIVKQTPEWMNMGILHQLLVTLTHFEKEQLDHSRFEDRILIPKLSGIVFNPINEQKEVLMSVRPLSTNEPSKALTDREKDVLTLIAMGLSNKQIADKLFISIHTVVTHRKNITSKLGIKSIPGLTLYAVINNYITFPS